DCVDPAPRAYQVLFVQSKQRDGQDHTCHDTDTQSRREAVDGKKKSSHAGERRGEYFGADDYMTKPFHKDELVARIQALVEWLSHVVVGAEILTTALTSVTGFLFPIHGFT